MHFSRVRLFGVLDSFGFGHHERRWENLFPTIHLFTGIIRNPLSLQNRALFRNSIGAFTPKERSKKSLKPKSWLIQGAQYAISPILKSKVIPCPSDFFKEDTLL